MYVYIYRFEQQKHEGKSRELTLKKCQVQLVKSAEIRRIGIIPVLLGNGTELSRGSWEPARGPPRTYSPM